MDNRFLSAKLSGGMNEEDGVVLCVTSTKSQPLLSKSGCVAVLAPKASRHTQAFFALPLNFDTKRRPGYHSVSFFVLSLIFYDLNYGYS